MPELSRFFGIVIRMFSEPESQHHLPHIHVEYQGERCVYSIDGELISGFIPARARKLVEAWIVIHEDELLSNWERLSLGEPANKIAPLE